MGTKLNITEGIFPMPALMIGAYNEDGSVNVMNAALGTMQERDIVALNLTETHKTVQNIKAQGDLYRQHCRCRPHGGSRLLRRGIRQPGDGQICPQRADRQQGRNRGCAGHQRVPHLSGMSVHRESGRGIWLLQGHGTRGRGFQGRPEAEKANIH